MTQEQAAILSSPSFMTLSLFVPTDFISFFPNHYIFFFYTKELGPWVPKLNVSMAAYAVLINTIK